MMPHERENLLFVDVETHEDTLQVLSIQWRYRGEHGIVTEFDDESYTLLKSLWDRASAVVAWNALFDLGALSVAYPQNQFDATKKAEPRPGQKSPGRNWKITVFGHYYHMRKVGGHHNFITPYNRVDGAVDDDGKGIKSTPVIDLIKLWAILIDSKNLSLSAVVKRHLQRDLIPYSAEAALTDAYRYQDVDVLDELVDVFLEKVSTIEDLDGYTCEMWSKIVSPATFVKIAYEREYPGLRKNPADKRSRSMREKNERNDRRYRLTRALEDAYFGGITISLFHGRIENAIWYDIKGAYSRAIQVLNTDQYLAYDWRAVPEPERIAYDRDRPALCHVTTDAVMSSINRSLKIYRVAKPCQKWYWNFDVQTLRLLFPDCAMTVERAYEPIPLNPVAASLPGKWDRMKDEEQARNGKTTRREFFKLLSNTSYGIKAQREPRVTAHTNLCIAGMITARSHLALIEMADECQRHGLVWRYSDTDSVCVTGEYFDGLTDAINARIAPFTAECEGYGESALIFSLKRYIRNPDSVTPMVRVHGKGKYRLSERDFLAFVRGKQDRRDLFVSELCASTPLTMKILSRHKATFSPEAVQNIFPFAFATDIPTVHTVHDFMLRWREHIDTKTSTPSVSTINDNFTRDFLTFQTDGDACVFFGGVCAVDDDIADPTSTDVVDNDIVELFPHML
jgi:hypothetical protein